jgi:4a-hydroxytetrahydrobiopterin dehydratase
MKSALSAEALREAHCTALTAADRLSESDLAAQLAATPQWRVNANALERTFTFGNFHHTMAFANTVAAIADSEDHHPRMVIEYGRCALRFDTHSAGGITRNDFICAAKIDALRLEGPNPARA